MPGSHNRSDAGSKPAARFADGDRGLAVLVGVFLIKAAVEHEPKEAIGLDGSLQELVSQDLGPALLGAVPPGLLIYARQFETAHM